MSGTPRHGLNGKIYLDTSSAGTMAVGTTNLEVISSKNQWSFDQSRDFAEVTAFGDTSKTNLAGLPSTSGDISGFWDAAGTLIYNLITATTERSIVVYPDFTNNLGTYFSGKALFSVKSGGSTSSAVTFDIHFEAGPTGIAWTHP